MSCISTMVPETSTTCILEGELHTIRNTLLGHISTHMVCMGTISIFLLNERREGSTIWNTVSWQCDANNIKQHNHLKSVRALLLQYKAQYIHQVF